MAETNTPDIAAQSAPEPVLGDNLSRSESQPETPPVPAPEAEAPATKARRGRPPKTEKVEKAPEPEKPKRRGGRPPKNKAEKAPDEEKAVPSTEETAPTQEDAPTAPEQPAPPKEAPRPNGTDQIVYLNLSELHPFKNHPFGVRDDAEMRSLVESVKAGGVNQPAIVRPREGGGYELIAGHRRQAASEMAGISQTL